MKRKAKNEKVGKKIVFAITLDPFAQDCIVVVNGSLEDAVKLLKKQKTKNADITVKHLEDNWEDYQNRKHTDGGAILYHNLPAGYIMTFDHIGWVDTVGLVVHESSHLVHYVLDRAGIKWCEDSDETYAYLIEKTVEDILREIY